MSRVLPLFLLLAAACQKPGEAMIVGASTREAPPPLRGVANAYEEAGRHELRATDPSEYPGLHNVYRLSDAILSGSEPHGEEAFRELARMGVKVVVSVDGKAPDAEVAARHGLRYVHVPIQYKAITEDETLRLAKAFRELDGPFYVHCFHGKHRGPAAAAIGRLVRDGASREQAIAEMRQWCGTAAIYEGLYQAIASQEMPAASVTAAYAWDFPATAPLGDFRLAMVDVARTWDNLELLQGRDWKADPEHPDVDAVNEAEKLAGTFARSLAIGSVKTGPEDFRDWTRVSAEEGAALVEALREARTGQEKAFERARKAMRVLKQTCTSCHAGYRNQ